MSLNLKATLKTALSFIAEQGLKDSYRDWCGGWAMPDAAKVDAADEVVGIRAVRLLARMVVEGTLSEGQVCNIIGIDRHDLRGFMSEVDGPGHTDLMVAPEAIDAATDGIEVPDVGGCLWVSQLPWVSNGAGQWGASTPFGGLRITANSSDSPSSYMLWLSGTSMGETGVYPTLDAAKFAAQADYDARIRSALTPSTPDTLGE